MAAGWLVPTLIYIVLVGSVGVTSKLALRTLAWQDLMLWQASGFVLVAALWLAVGAASFELVSDTRWALVSALLVMSANIALFLALERGQASRVVPVTAGYSAVTVLLAALVLSEPVSAAGLGGLVLVVAGVVVLTGSE